MNFKVGDIVRCINDEGFHYITYNESYRIVDIVENRIRLENLDGSEFDNANYRYPKDRFRLTKLTNKKIKEPKLVW